MKVLLQIIVSVACVIAARLLMIKHGFFPIYRMLRLVGIEYAPAAYYLSLAALSAVFWFVVFYRRRPKLMTKPYTIDTQGDRAIFHVHPQPLPVAGLITLILLMSAAAAGLLSFVTNTGIMFPVYMAIIFYLYFRYVRAGFDKKRKITKEPFTVTPVGVTLGNGQSVSLDEIHQVVLKNAYDDDPDHIVAGNSMVVGTAMAASSMRHKFAQRSYYVAILHGGIETVLAGGMNEPQARGVFIEVTRRLGMN